MTARYCKHGFNPDHCQECWTEHSRSSAEITDAQLLELLDAYGHLTWTLGDDDWIACFDAIRVGNRIAYHVVVNCESGSWIDTIEKGVIPLAEAETLLNLPDRYVDSGMENHLDARQKREQVGRFHYRDCERSWRRHIKHLMNRKH